MLNGENTLFKKFIQVDTLYLNNMNIFIFRLPRSFYWRTAGADQKLVADIGVIHTGVSLVAVCLYEDAGTHVPLHLQKPSRQQFYMYAQTDMYASTVHDQII